MTPRLKQFLESCLETLDIETEKQLKKIKTGNDVLEYYELLALRNELKELINKYK